MTTTEMHEIFEDIINPILAQHGGFCSVVELNQKDLVVAFGGNCAGCPGKRGGTKRLIENILEDLELDFNVIVQ